MPSQIFCNRNRCGVIQHRHSHNSRAPVLGLTRPPLNLWPCTIKHLRHPKPITPSVLNQGQTQSPSRSQGHSQSHPPSPAPSTESVRDFRDRMRRRVGPWQDCMIGSGSDLPTTAPVSSSPKYVPPVPLFLAEVQMTLVNPRTQPLDSRGIPDR